MIHALKIETLFFDDVINGTKKFEYRKNDRAFRVGDYIALNEVMEDGEYTGRSALFRIDYILGGREFSYSLPEGYVILSISPCCFHHTPARYGINERPTVTDTY